MFKVVPDQLRISEGWVRCGHCEEVFDAESHLVSGRAAPAVELEISRSGAPEVKASGKRPAPTGQVRQPESPASEKHETQVRLLAEDRVLESEFPNTQDLDSIPGETPSATFLHMDKRDRAQSTSTLARVLLGLSAMVLGLLLSVQILWQERERVVTYEPALKPWLQALCDEVGCVIEPLRQIESIVIDSTAFNKVRDDVYRFNLTLKNTAAVELATPAIELSLTDIADQPVIRKVFMPQELGFDRPIMAPMGEGNASLVLGVRTRDASERIAGYRVLAFYP